LTTGIVTINTHNINLGGTNRFIFNISDTGGSAEFYYYYDNQADLGTSSCEWKDLYLDGIAYIDDLRGDIAQLGGAINYINVAAGGILTMAGSATIDGVAAGNLVDKSASETIAGEWTFSIFPITPSAAPDANYEVANKKYVDDTGADKVVFLGAGNAVIQTNATTAEQGYIPVISFTDNAAAQVIFGSAKVPKSCTSISSIKIFYYNTNPSTNLFLTFYTEHAKLGSAAEQDISDAETTYATGGTVDRWDTITVPTTAYDALTNIAADDLISIWIYRDGANVLDTYNADWKVTGILFTFA